MTESVEPQAIYWMENIIMVSLCTSLEHHVGVPQITPPQFSIAYNSRRAMITIVKQVSHMRETLGNGDMSREKLIVVVL